jgi:hypothetical protein
MEVGLVLTGNEKQGPLSQGQRPVFDGEAANSSEFAGVIRHEDEIETARMGCQQQIVGSDHLAAVF